MDKYLKNFYSVGNFSTFMITFIDGEAKVDEYIHCFILEHLETDSYGSPIVLKVKQIYNLKEYSIDKNDENTRERVLRVSEIKIIQNVFNL